MLGTQAGSLWAGAKAQSTVWSQPDPAPAGRAQRRAKALQQQFYLGRWNERVRIY